MRSVILVLGALGILGASVVSVSSPSGQAKEKADRPTLQMHHDGCMKCHGDEGELMSPGWADNRSRQELVAILEQMVVEQAGMAELVTSERDALVSFHLALSKGEPWANVIETGGQWMILESTKDSRLSAALPGKKVAVEQIRVKQEGGGGALLRWKINLPKGSATSQLQVTLARGTGPKKKVVRWRPSERPFSQPL